MSNNQEYKVLARKYRPQNFADLIGQEILVNILTNSITTNRTAHAYVLTGVRGVGKTTTARLIAMSLNCEKRKNNNFEPCGTCNSCLSIKQDNNMDVIEMDAASKTGVDDIREIIDNVKYKPVTCIFKIFIIDEVHMLSKNAFNALLKTLEEPPEHVKFIFATTEVKKIPITILSRCHRFDLQRIESQILTKHLLKIAEKENINIEKDAMALIVRAADGSVRDGLSLMDQAIANKNKIIDSKIIEDMLGLANRGKIFDLLDSIFQGKASEALKIYNDLHQSGADIIMIFDEMLNVVHFVTQIKIVPSLKDNVYIPELERVRGLEMSSKLNMQSLGLIWQVLFKGYQELQNGFHLFQHGEMIILRLIYLNKGPSPEDLLNKYKNQTKDNTESENFETTTKISEKDNYNNETVNKTLESDNLKKNFNSSIPINNFRNFVELFYVNKEGIIHSKLYNHAKLISYKEGELILNTESLNDPHFSRTVAKLVSKWTGRIWQINSSTSNIGKSLYEEDLINQQKEIENMQKNPIIKNVLEKFPGISIHSITDIRETKDDDHINESIKKEKEI
ncbi:MAG: DNA polymerase III subunit gamma/tau [Gammaproteobacteria bacterium]|nr:DNA polymerase III subunit gamma/tau [Gammaproteobacteria bacterium]|tara:strand:+ start:3074 stop:4768 length:1695 start_codon:yes stop_codon:yes gene_type:complete